MWTLRTWTKYPDGWQSEFESFPTREEAEEHKEILMRVFKDDCRQHDYHIYFAENSQE